MPNDAPPDECPLCCGGSLVTDSRVRGSAKHRRRVCRECGHRWSTVETMATAERGAGDAE